MSKRITALVLAVCVGACSATPPPPPVSMPTPEPEPAPVIEPVPTEPEIIEPKPLVIDLGEIEGATPAKVISYMGPPSLVRRDENVQVMIFEAERCVVEVVFYEPANGDYFRAERIAARSRKGQDMNTEPCVRQWLEENLPDY